MNSRALGFVAAVVLGFGLVSTVAQARPADLYKLWIAAYGEPVAVGILTSAGGSNVTNASTAVPFSMPAATLTQAISIQCDAAAFVGFGSTCSTTLASSGGCFRINANDRPVILFASEASTGAGAVINAAGPAGFNCVINRLR